jgi:hypothetical protein
MTPPARRRLVVAQYNVNYIGEGGEGDPHKHGGLDGIEAMLRALAPDVVTLSEVERGCQEVAMRGGTASTTACQGTSLAAAARARAAHSGPSKLPQPPMIPIHPT